MGHLDGKLVKSGKRLRKAQRREQILYELRLRPHVRIAEMARKFGVSTETVRRDLDKLSREGLIARAHGGASSRQHYPDLDQRSHERVAECEAIGRRAAALVRPGDTVMIDSGSTTLQLARFLAAAVTPCIVITNSLTIATTLGQSDAVEVIMCPGDFLACEAAVVGTDTVDFLNRHNVDRCLIGATGLTRDGLSETVRGFAAVKRAMLDQSAHAHLLIDSGKLGKSGLARVGNLGELSSIVVDTAPEADLGRALEEEKVDVIVAD